MNEVAGRVRAHFDARAPTYARATPWVSDPQSLEPIAQLVAEASAERVLEIGVGSGAVPNFLRHSGELPTCYIGLDVSSVMLEQADGWSPVQGDASYLPFCDCSIGLIIVRQAFHYFELPHDILAEMVRVLTEPGALVVAQITPFENEVDITWWSRAVTLRQPLRRHVWTAASLEGALRSIGFTVETVVQVKRRSSLRDWLNRYPIDAATAQDLLTHYRQAPADVRRSRQFEFRADGDIHFSIQWSILFGRRSGAKAEQRTHVGH